MSNKKFGEWLGQLAAKADAATQETLDAIKVKLQKEQQDRLEGKLRHVLLVINEQVAILRQIRRQEEAAKAEIKQLEALADKIIAGEDDEDISVAVRRCSGHWSR